MFTASWNEIVYEFYHEECLYISLQYFISVINTLIIATNNKLNNILALSFSNVMLQ